MDGNMNLSSQLAAAGLPLAQTLTGSFDLTLGQGRIQRFNLLAKVLAVVNITEIVVGQLPDLVNQGMAYTQIQAKASLSNGLLTIHEIIMDADSLKLNGQGTVDVIAGQVDLSLSLAPLKTVDRIIRNLPVVGDILQGTLVAIPVKVTGPLTEPDVSYMPLGAVGSNLIDLMMRTLKYPFKLFIPQSSAPSPQP
jgi:uncharacterized protein YhdP